MLRRNAAFGDGCANTREKVGEGSGGSGAAASGFGEIEENLVDLTRVVQLEGVVIAVFGMGRAKHAATGARRQKGRHRKTRGLPGFA